MSKKRVKLPVENVEAGRTGKDDEFKRSATQTPAEVLTEGHLRRRHRTRIRLRLPGKKSYRVSVYGDSISKGVTWDAEAGKYRVLSENYAALVGQRLKGSLTNRARFGMTLERAMGRSVSELDKLKPSERPDMVLIEYGGNDCDFDWEAIARDPEAKHDPKTDITRFRELLRSLTVSFSSIGILPVLMTLPPLDADRYFTWVSRNDPEAGARILSWLGTTSKIYWWQERYNAAVLEIAAEQGTHVIDLRTAFLREPDYREYLCKDGIHPNAKGHALMADSVSAWLSKFCSRMLRDHHLAESPGKVG